MKKVLFVSLALAVGMTGFAQKGAERIKYVKPMQVKADLRQEAMMGEEAPAFVFAPNSGVPSNFRGADYEGWATMMTRYDIQSNSWVGNRMISWEDGSVAVTSTWSQLANMTDRGSGYNYYDGTAFQWDEFDGQPMPGRIEADKTGWPTICEYGPQGEIVFSHQGFGSGETKICYYYREKKGEGEWQGPNYIPNPVELGAPVSDMTWPRAVASGTDHSVLHVIAASSDPDESNMDVYSYYSRSTDGGQTWTTTFIPTLDPSEYGRYSADHYAMAANGNTVAIMLASMSGHGYVIKSNDNGETWEQIKFWDNPYAGDWMNDESTLFGSGNDDYYDDTEMYGPEMCALCIDNNGMVHAAISSHRYSHPVLGSSYYYSYGRTIDGVFYWNESMGTLQGPEWTCPDDGYVIPSNPCNVFRMWWPTSEPVGEEYYITRNFESANLIGFFLPTETVPFNEISSDNLLVTNYFQNMSTTPAISVDATGTVAIAYSSIDTDREMYNNGQYFYRSVYVAFIEPGYVMGDATGDWTDIPGNCYYAYYKMQDTDDFLHSADEAVYCMAAPNATNHEFWFGYMADDTPGTFSSSSPSQTVASDNYLWVHKVVPDYEDLGINKPAVNPMTNTRVYPNPVTDQMTIEVNASQASEMSISVYNLMGQKVMDKNVSINTGVNTPTLNTSSLSSGVYFVTVKANGFENTMKFVVK